MGKMTLGLEDRSARLIHGTDVWAEISDLLSGYGDIQAAITAVGSDADQFLTLRGPASIVVDAGPQALQSGSTDPGVLLGWVRRGVRVYSLPSLRATVILAQGTPSFALVGSPNATKSAGAPTYEALLVADERETVEEVRVAIDGWIAAAGAPLTDEWLQVALDRYQPVVPSRIERIVERLPQRPPAPARTARSETPTYSDSARTGITMHEPTATESSMPPSAVTEPAVTEPAVDHSAVPETAGTEPAPSSSATSTSSKPVPKVTTVAPTGRAAAAVRAVAADPQDWASEDEDELGEAGPIFWARPKYIYLAPLSRDGRASLSALERLRHLKGEHRVRSEDDGRPVLEVEMFWREESIKSGGKPAVQYREGWHVVPIQMLGTVRPTTSSLLTSPGRVLQSYTDYTSHPARTYYYLLVNSGGSSMTYRVLRDMLAAMGERPSFDHAYMMQHKVEAILELWPEIEYSD